MARRRRVEIANVGEDHDDVVAWYRAQLAEPATFPWAGLTWVDSKKKERPLVPERIGPTWQTTPDGHWLLPDATLGWDVLGFCGTWLQHGKGQPWRFTLEQARFLLWWMALDETGRFLYRDFVLQRLKGWGKDPFAACLCFVEAFGPARFAEWDKDGPIATDVPNAWVQSAAVSLEQTKNTFRLFPSLITAEARRRFGIPSVGKETIYGLGDQRLIQAVTSSPATLEGARSTFVELNETQHWDESNQGDEMADVIERNATKSPDGAARTGRITNAYDPSGESVAQADREAYEKAAEGESLTTGILYDSLEAPAELPLTADTAELGVLAVRGDSVWLDASRIVQSMLDTRNPPSRSRRFWWNQIWAAENAWVQYQHFDLCAAADRNEVGGKIVLFFDGSKSDDATGLVGCRMSDGHVITLGMWQRPSSEKQDEWRVNRDDVDAVVREVFDSYDVVAFWADPSHALDDETEDLYWDSTLDLWHRRYRDRLNARLWAKPGKGKEAHSILWDMAAHQHQSEFVAAAMQCATDIKTSAAAVVDGHPEKRSITYDGDGRLRRHVRQARRRQTSWGTTFGKEHRESAKKVDLAVCMVGARMLRRVALNTKVDRERSGRVWS